MTPIETLIQRLTDLEAKATKGPWFWNLNEKSKQICLEGRGTVLDFVRWGMSGATARFRGSELPNLMRDARNYGVEVEGRKHHASWFKTIDHPDAQLIAESRNALPLLIAEIRRLRKIEEAAMRVCEVAEKLGGCFDHANNCCASWCQRCADGVASQDELEKARAAITPAQGREEAERIVEARAEEKDAEYRKRGTP